MNTGESKLWQHFRRHSWRHWVWHWIGESGLCWHFSVASGWGRMLIASRKKTPSLFRIRILKILYYFGHFSHHSDNHKTEHCPSSFFSKTFQKLTVGGSVWPLGVPGFCGVKNLSTSQKLYFIVDKLINLPPTSISKTKIFFDRPKNHFCKSQPCSCRWTASSTSTSRPWRMAREK